MPKKKRVDPIPGEFSSEEEAAEFWDKHDTMDYLEFSRPVGFEGRLLRRHYEIEVEPDLIKPLKQRAEKKHTTLNRLANQLIRQSLAA